MKTSRPTPATGENSRPASQPQHPFLLRSVGLKTFWDERRSIAWWCVGSALLSAIVIMLYPSIAVPEMEQMLEVMPPAIRALIGEDIDLASVAGYLDVRLFTFIMPVIVLVYGIGRGTAAIADEEQRGTMDLLLALPVRRARVVLEKSVTMFAGLAAISLSTWLGLVVGGLLLGVEFDLSRALQACFMGMLLGLVHGTLALAIGSGTGRTGVAIGVSTAVGVAGYLLYSLAPLVAWLEPFQVLSPFYFFIGESAMRRGIEPLHALVLIVLSLICIAAAVALFERRDVQV